tara:strand:- start:239 stop:766 length:528 start_codon:yes stop_codon:yes gene_type:complete
MKDKWHPIEWIYKDHAYFLGFAIKQTKDKDLSEDLVQETFLQLMTMNQHKLLIIIDSGKIKTYICKIMMVKYYSAKSQFNKKMVQYKKKKIQSDESFLEHLANINSPEHHQETLNQMNEKIDNCLLHFDEYDRKLFQLYYETGLSVRQLSEETGISFKSIQYTIDKVKKNIKNII